MKRKVQAAIDATYGYALDEYMESVDAMASRYHYNLAYTDVTDITFTPQNRAYYKYMPTIHVTAFEEGGLYQFEPTMEFTTREITYEDITYADSFEYIMDLYKDAAKICTYLMDNPFDPTMYDEY